MYTLDITPRHVIRSIALFFLLISLLLTVLFFNGSTYPGLYAFEVRFNNTLEVAFPRAWLLQDDHSNQMRSILLSQDAIRPCVDGHHIINLRPLYNNTVLIPCFNVPIRMGYYTLCSVFAETRCVNSHNRNITELLDSLSLPTPAYGAVWKAVMTQNALMIELPSIALVLLVLSLITGLYPFIRGPSKRIHRICLFLLELALTFVILAMCNIAWIVRGLRAATDPLPYSVAITGGNVRVQIGRKGMVVAGIAVLFGVLSGAGLVLARMGEEIGGYDGDFWGDDGITSSKNGAKQQLGAAE